MAWQINDMSNDVTTADPLIMHIDLNSCFATIEQQANPLIRNKPVAVAAYTKDYGMILAASYDAKAMGIKLGTSVREARRLCPGIVVLMPDPPKYREAHKRFKRILLDYTSDVAPKSIDEFVIDFRGSPTLRQRATGQHSHDRDNQQSTRSPGNTLAILETIGYEIKDRIKQELGEYVTVNVGIGTNRFLAKLAAGLHKPDGLDIITHTNLISTLKSVDLLDLPGINRRFKTRLLAAGISTPYEMFLADAKFLKNFVFFSKLGYHWYQRLRGWEVGIDAAEFTRKTIGHQYALEHKTADLDELRRLLMKLCEKVGRRLRRNALAAGGIHLHVRFANQFTDRKGRKGPTGNNPMNVDDGFGAGGYFRSTPSSWQHGHKTAHQLYATQDIYRAAEALLVQGMRRVQNRQHGDQSVQIDQQGYDILNVVTHMSVTVFDLAPCSPEQLGLFDQALTRRKALADAADRANDRFGEFTVVPAIMADMNKTILDRIAFGGIRDME